MAFRPATLLKRDFNTCFPVNIATFLRTAFLRTSQVADFLEDQSRLNELYYQNLYIYENISQTSENI